MLQSLYNYTAHVKKVVDGDTIVVDIDLGFSISLNNQHLRLARINTPELKGSTKEAGEAAREALTAKLLDRSVRIKTHKVEKDKYGRVLAEVFIEDECVNDWLLTEGFAVPYE